MYMSAGIAIGDYPPPSLIEMRGKEVIIECLNNILSIALVMPNVIEMHTFFLNIQKLLLIDAY